MAGRRRSRYDLGIVEHELVQEDSGAPIPMGPGAPPPASAAPPSANAAWAHDDATGAGAQALIETMHRDLEETLRAELRAVEMALATHTRDLDARVRSIQAEIERVRAETRALQENPVHQKYEAARQRFSMPL